MIPLHIAQLTKRYGDRVAVDDLTLSIASGTVFGLIGRNGAGKSTAIACVLGLLRATSGEVAFFGDPLRSKSFERIAYVPEINCLDAWMTPLQHAEFRRQCFSRFDAALMRELLERFEIEPKRALRKLSKGQRQAVALALAFAQRPELMILDEPASGLDPVLQRRLSDAIVSTAADGVTIVFSSHQIGHVEQAAERIGILDRGKLVLEADVDDLREERALVEAYFETLPDLTSLRSAITSSIEVDGTLVRVYANGDAAEVEDRLRALAPVTVSRRAMTIEQIFFATIGASKEYRG
ncbi:MAG: ABC transporter ATP-binding protein [Candidatus Aquilonibacter sp.]|jgi:ABC-2 type transport system ATP-binding protein